MDWLEISIRADGEAAEAVSELFNRLNSRGDGEGGAVVEVGGFDPIGDDHRPFVTVRTYLPADLADVTDRQRQIEEGLWFLGRIYPLGEPHIRRLAEEDWANAWKASYQPLRIGRRFLVVPAWLTADVPGASEAPGTLPIILDPGMAFGTGLHPSTQLCLRLMEATVKPDQRVLDAGCGSGILSIAAARLGAASVDAFDIDPIAVRATEENAALNDLPLAINVIAAAGPDDGSFWRLPDGARRTWDVILVNILPHVIIGLLEAGLHEHLASDGCLILAGIIEERKREILKQLEQHGLELAFQGTVTDGDWVALVAHQKDELAGSEWPRRHWLRRPTTIAEVEADFEEDWRRYFQYASTKQQFIPRNQIAPEGVTTEDTWIQAQMRTSATWQEWKRLKSAVQEGDELWRFAGSLTPYADLAMMKFHFGHAMDLAMRAGVALMRNEEVVDFIILWMS